MKYIYCSSLHSYSEMFKDVAREAANIAYREAADIAYREAANIEGYHSLQPVTTTPSK